MTKAAADLLDPVGDLDAAVLWPHLSRATVATKLTKYLARAYARADVGAIADADAQDDAALGFAYYLAYASVYVQMVRRAATIEVASEGAKRVLAEQIAAMKALRDEALAAFEDLVLPVDSNTVVRQDAGVSVTTPLNFGF